MGFEKCTEVGVRISIRAVERSGCASMFAGGEVVKKRRTIRAGIKPEILEIEEFGRALRQGRE